MRDVLAYMPALAGADVARLASYIESVERGNPAWPAAASTAPETQELFRLIQELHHLTRQVDSDPIARRDEFMREVVKARAAYLRQPSRDRHMTANRLAAAVAGVSVLGAVASVAGAADDVPTIELPFNLPGILGSQPAEEIEPGAEILPVWPVPVLPVSLSPQAPQPVVPSAAPATAAPGPTKETAPDNAPKTAPEPVAAAAGSGEGATPVKPPHLRVETVEATAGPRPALINLEWLSQRRVVSPDLEAELPVASPLPVEVTLEGPSAGGAEQPSTETTTQSGGEPAIVALPGFDEEPSSEGPADEGEETSGQLEEPEETKPGHAPTDPGPRGETTSNSQGRAEHNGIAAPPGQQKDGGLDEPPPGWARRDEHSSPASDNPSDQEVHGPDEGNSNKGSSEEHSNKGGSNGVAAVVAAVTEALDEITVPNKDANGREHSNKNGSSDVSAVTEASGDLNGLKKDAGGKADDDPPGKASPPAKGKGETKDQDGSAPA